MMVQKQVLNQELERIVEVLKNKYKPEKIIAYGSIATGKIHEWSDIDIAIIKKTSKKKVAKEELAKKTKNKVEKEAESTTEEKTLEEKKKASRFLQVLRHRQSCLPTIKCVFLFWFLEQPQTENADQDYCVECE